MDSEKGHTAVDETEALDEIVIDDSLCPVAGDIDYAEAEERVLAGLSDEELRLLDEAASPARPIDTKALAAQLVAAASGIEEEKIVVKAAGDTAEALKLIIADAKAGDRRALNKLRAFETFEDPQLAARVALMNNKERRAFMAARRGKNRSRRGKR